MFSLTCSPWSGPGGYRFADYLKVGIPLDALFAVIAIALIPIIWPFS